MDEGTKRFVILVSVSVSSLIALGIITASIATIFFTTLEIPDTFKDWGGIILGFYFGSFIGLLKDWAGTKTEFAPEQENAAK